MDFRGITVAVSEGNFMNRNTLNPLAARLITLWFLSFTLLAAIGGTIWLVYTFWFVSHASRAQGHIVAMRASHGPHGDTDYSPVYAFDDASGITHTQICSVSSSSFSYEVGDAVPVLYDPARPLHSNIDSFGTVWLFPLLILGVSFVSGSFIVVLLFAQSRMAQNRQIQGFS